MNQMKSKHYFKIIIFLITGVIFSSCYEDYIFDYKYSTVYFAMDKPYRTVIADRDMELRIGVSIGGKRNVDMNDWAEFKIDTLGLPAGKLLMPENYFTLTDANTMRVSKANLPVADVGIKFTDDFFADPASITGKYVLPLKIVNSSLDTITRESTVVCFKYISTFHGSYYVKGKLYELDAPNGNVVDSALYEDKDLVKNIVRDLSTLDRYTLIRPGLADFTVTGSEKVKLTVTMNDSKDKIYDTAVETATGGTAITNGSGTYYGNEENPKFVLKYDFAKGGKEYRVNETLILRQDPLYDLRVESW